jgi:hypothetical protein
MRRFWLALCLTVALAACESGPREAGGVVELSGNILWLPEDGDAIGGGPVRLSYHYISETVAREFLELAERKVAAIEDYLGRTAKNPIEIFDRDDEYPFMSRAYGRFRPDGDANFRIGIHRERIEQSGGDTTLVHELTHAIAGPAKDNNLFLAEGLAVHVHGQLSEPTEAMSYARLPVGRAARQVLAKYPGFPSLAELYRDPSILRSTPTLDRTVIRRKQATYIVVGSFVRFVVEKHGIERFMRVYESGDFRAVYGAAIADLESEWRAGLGGVAERPRDVPVLEL